MATATGRRNHAENREYSRNLLAQVSVTKMMHQITEASECVLFWAPSTFQRRYKLFRRLEQFHEDTEEWREYAQRMFCLDKIMERMLMFLTSAVIGSVSTVRKGKRMSSTSLRTLRDDVLGLIINFCPDSTKDLATAWTERMERHCRYLIDSFDLPKDMRPKQYWGPAELRLLIEESFQLLASPKNGMTMDQILQHILLWSLMMMTGCRPGSFLKTSHYPDEWLKFSDLALRRTPQRGVFDVLVTIRHWKGGHTNRPYVATFTVRGITHENMWSMDVGLQLIAIGLRRRGFLKYETLDELLDGEDLILQWKPEFGKESVFCGGVPGGRGLNYDKVLHYASARLHLRLVAANCGLGSVLEGVVLYCFRRGLAALLHIIFGSEMAKGVLHHQVHSDTLSERYSNAAVTADFTGAVVEGVAKQIRESTHTNAPALHRSENAKKVTRLTVKEAVEAHPRLQTLYAARKFLAEHIKSASTDWTLILPTLVDIWMKDGESHFIDDLGVREIVERLEITDTDIVDKCVLDAPEDHDEHMALCGDIYKHVHARYARLLRLVRDDHQKDMISETYAKDLENMTLNTYEERRQETQKPIGLPPVLRSMLEEESNREARIAAEKGENAAERVAEDIDLECNPDAAVEASSLLEMTPDQMARRIGLLRVWVSYQDESRGRQQCPVCSVDPSLPSDVQARFYKSAYKFQCHVDVNHRPDIQRRQKGSVFHARRRKEQEDDVPVMHFPLGTPLDRVLDHNLYLFLRS